MELWLTLVLLLGSFLFLLFMGFPVFLSFFAANLLVLSIHSGPRAFSLMPVSMFDSLNSFIMLAAPLFMLMGELLFRCGFINLIIDVFEKFFGKVPGRTAVLTTGAATGLATLSGNPLASCATLGITLVPVMVDKGYRKWLAYGAAIGGGTLATVIPPSFLAIVVAAIAEKSPGKVLIGSAIPGLGTAALFIIFIIVVSTIWPQVAPEDVHQRSPLKEKALSLFRALPLLFIFFLVLLTIFLGIGTATEAAAMGVLGAFILALIYRRITWEAISESLLSTVKTTVQIFVIIAGSRAFSYVLSITGAGPRLVEAVAGVPLPPLGIVILMLFSLLLFGCFLDSISMVMICIPLYLPVIISLGYDPIWFCVLFLLMLGVAGITPPVGMVLYTLKGVRPEASMADIFRGVIPFFTLQLLVVLLVILIPSLALWLPGLMG